MDVFNLFLLAIDCNLSKCKEIISMSDIWLPVVHPGPLSHLPLPRHQHHHPLPHLVISANAATMMQIPTMLIPVTWFPQHKGKVIGMITSGYRFKSSSPCRHSSLTSLTLTTFLLFKMETPVLHMSWKKKFWKTFQHLFCILGVSTQPSSFWNYTQCGKTFSRQ